MEDRVIVALDGISKKRAMELAAELGGTPGLWGFKVNSLLRREGYDTIADFKLYGRVFADLKLHDIPNTVKNDIMELREYEPDFVTIHASGGLNMLKTAVEAAEDKMNVIAVTVLTSITDEMCRYIYNSSVIEKVFKFAKNAYDAGVKHLVCSFQEINFLKTHHAEVATMKLVVPGIRPSWYQALQVSDDQKRVSTAREAISEGADYLVIGRPITKYSDPVEAVKRTVEEIYSGL